INNQEYISSFIPIRAWEKLTGSMIVLENVSKYEKIAQELEVTRRIEQMLDSALEAAYDGVVITDPDGTITKVNQGFLELTGFESGNNLVGRSEEHTSELQSRFDLVCRLLLEKKKGSSDISQTLSSG